MTEEHVKLVLASGSPRRLALLEQVGLTPDLLNPTLVDELPRKNEAPRSLAKRLARTKAEAAMHSRQVAELGPSRFIIAADTVVAVGRRIVPKPDSIDEAAAALHLLSGRRTGSLPGSASPRRATPCATVWWRPRCASSA